MSMSSKTTQFSLECFSFIKQLAVLIEEHSEIGPMFLGSIGFKKRTTFRTN